MEDKDSFSNIDLSEFKFSGRTEFFELDHLDFSGIGGETRKEASKVFLDAQAAMEDAAPQDGYREYKM